MSYFVTLLLFAIGIFLIVKGGDFFVDASTWLASVSGIPKFIIGATIVSFATTLPELLVSVFAAAENEVSMSIGNAVGSVTANTGLIMGISIVCIPSIIKRKDYALKSIFLIGSALLIALFGAKDIILSGNKNGNFSIFASILLLIIFILAMLDNIKTAKTAFTNSKEKKEAFTKKELRINLLKFIGGAAAITIGAQLLVTYGKEIASWLGDGDTYNRIVGVTFIAIGTSLPELVTTITAISKKQASLSVGNIIGANIIDLSLILPISAVVYGGSLPVSRTVAMIDLPACLIITLICLIPTLITKKFTRTQGIVLLLSYAAYLVITCTMI